MVEPCNFEELAANVRRMGLPRAVAAKRLRTQHVPPPGDVHDWDAPAVDKLLEDQQKRIVSKWRKQDLRTRPAQDVLYRELEAAGYSPAHAADVFNELGVNDAKWTKQVFVRRYHTPNAAEKLFVAAASDLAQDKLLELILKARAAKLNDSTIADMLQQEGIALPTDGRWTTQRLLDVVEKAGDAIGEAFRQKNLALRSTQDALLRTLIARGFSDREVARQWNRWKVPAPKAEKWGHKAIIDRLKLLASEKTPVYNWPRKYPWRPSKQEFFAGNLQGKIPENLWHPDAIARAVTWLRWHGLTLKEAADVLDARQARGLTQKRFWHHDEIRRKQLRSQRTAMIQARKMVRTKPDQAAEVIRLLDAHYFDPEQIASKLFELGLRNQDMTWTPTQVAEVLTRQEPDISIPAEFQVEEGLKPNGGNFRWRPNGKEFAAAGGSASIPMGLRGKPAIRAAIAWMRRHGFTYTEIARVLEERDARLPAQKAAWIPETAHQTHHLAIRNVEDIVFGLDRKDPSTAEVALRYFDALGMHPEVIADKMNEAGLHGGVAEWTEGGVAAALDRMSANSSLTLDALIAEKDWWTGPSRRQRPWKHQREEFLAGNRAQWIPEGLTSGPDIRKAVSWLSWHGLGLDEIGEILRAKHAKVRRRKNTWSPEALASIMGLARVEALLQTHSLRQNGIHAAKQFISTLDASGVRPEAIVDALTARGWSQENDAPWDKRAVVDVLLAPGMPGYYFLPEFADESKMKSLLTTAERVIREMDRDRDLQKDLMYSVRPLKEEEEKLLFAAMNFYLHRAAAAEREKGPFISHFSSANAAIEADRSSAAHIREFIVLANTRLMRKLAQSLIGHGISEQTIMDTGLDKLRYLVSVFDPGRGLKFSTLATTALKRELGSLVSDRKNADVSLDLQDRKWQILGHDTAPTSRIENAETESQVRFALRTLNERDQRLVRRYFGIGGTRAVPGPELAKKFRLSKQRVYQIIDEALRKMKAELDPDSVEDTSD